MIQIAESRSGDALCGFAAALKYDQLPEAVRTQNKLAISDIVGVALSGAAFGEGSDEIAAYARTAGGTGRSTIWATGERCAPGMAALANASHARGLDFDDITPFPQIHVSVHVVPALIALSEHLQRPVSGQDMLCATVVGCEIQARLARAIAPYFGASIPVLLSSQIFGYFSAALACARLLDLDATATKSAFGLALMQAAGTEEMVVHATRSMGKMLYAGLSNQAGLQCAMMAAAGVLAEGDPLGGRAGLFAALYGGKYDADSLSRDLGSEFESLNRCFKAAPGTLVAHSFAEAAALLMKQHAAAPDDISSIVLHVGGWGRGMCEPLDIRRHPPSASAAMNSIPFVVAKTIANGTIVLSDYREPARSQPAVQRIAERISYRHASELSRTDGLEEGIVEFVMSSGDSFRHTVRFPLGHPQRPMSVDQVVHKFHANVAASRRPSVAQRAGELVGRILELEKEPDVAALIGGIFGPHSEGSAT